MEQEQINNRLEWIEEELRKEKTKSSQLEERLDILEGKLDASEKQNKELDSEVTRLRTIIARVDDFDQDLAELRVETKRQEKKYEKDAKAWIGEAKKVLRTSIQNLDRDLQEVKSRMESVEDLEQELEKRSEEESRLNNRIREVAQDLAEVQR